MHKVAEQISDSVNMAAVFLIVSYVYLCQYEWMRIAGSCGPSKDRRMMFCLGGISKINTRISRSDEPRMGQDRGTATHG